jgi:hypothetical protein
MVNEKPENPLTMETTNTIPPAHEPTLVDLKVPGTEVEEDDAATAEMPAIVPPA